MYLQSLPLYIPSKRKILFPNGAQATIYSGYNPDQLRGPQHDAFWADELATWKYMRETWDNLMLGFRLESKGKESPVGIVTTTPRPLKLIKELCNNDRVELTTGTTYENIDNLPDNYINSVIGKYEGTRLGRQELYAEILEDNPDALWQRSTLEENRVESVPECVRIVVAVDPNASNKDTSDEIGIIVAGISGDGLYYVLEDGSMKGTPAEWAKKAVQLYDKYDADLIVAEKNQGGNMVEFVVRTVNPEVSYKGVHASKGKYTRAEPISALYEQGKVKHRGYFKELEDEFCEWVPGEKSPNRLDAAVWALTELTGKKKGKWGW
ncbi:MAG: terminase family protein [Bacteroidales bacterium]